MTLFLTPASTKAAPSRLQKKYRPPDSDPAFLRVDPPPDSVIVVAARKQHTVTPSSTVPPDKESRKLDSAGRKVCTTAAVSMKAASATALLGRYDRSIWDSLQQFIEHLPRDKREDFQEIINEGMMVSNQIISAAADTSLLAAHEFCHGITLRRNAWLRLTSLKPEAQQRLANLPFSGSTLFGAPADEEMARMKAEVETLKAVGLEKPKEQRKSFRPFQRRSTFSRFQRGQGRQGGQQQQSQFQRQPFQKRSRGRGYQQTSTGNKGQAGSKP